MWDSSRDLFVDLPKVMISAVSSTNQPIDFVYQPPNLLKYELQTK